MSETATITVKTAVKKDNGWYEVSDGDRVFSTKKAELGREALALEGEVVNVEFTVKENGNYTNRYLEAISKSANGGERPIDTRTPDGAPDWDKKGLHMTRCALWQAFLGGDLAQSLMAWWLRNNSEKGEAELQAFLRRMGTFLVTAAEFDQYNRDFAEESDLIPF